MMMMMMMMQNEQSARWMNGRHKTIVIQTSSFFKCLVAKNVQLRKKQAAHR